MATGLFHATHATITNADAMRLTVVSGFFVCLFVEHSGSAQQTVLGLLLMR
jgi:hypothetical protein